MKNSKDYTLFSFDPGKSNFGYSIIRNGKLIKIGMLKHTITNIVPTKTLTELRKEYVKELSSLIKLYRSNISTMVVAERYMTRRGGMRGSVAETTNIMIGILLSLFKKESVNLITSAQWKNWYTKRNLELDCLILTEHQLDSIRIGYYHLHKEGILSEKMLISKIKELNKKWKKFGKHILK